MDLTTTYMGLKLKNPIVPSAGPLTAKIDSIKQLAEAGAAAVVLHSLFEEQIKHEIHELDHHLTQGTESFAEALNYFPQVDEFRLGPDEYLDHIRAAKKAVNIPVIASLNGVSTGGWMDLAHQMEQAGADALELNVYYVATDVDLKPAEVEQRYIDVLKTVKSKVKIPVAMKIGPYFTAVGHTIKRLADAGADGLVLFNRFYQPDIDLETLEVLPDLELSTTHEMRLPLRWIAITRPHVKCSLAATTGVSTGEDVIKLVMAGADAVQICSVLLRRGVGTLAEIVKDVRTWGEAREYESIAQMKGSMSQKSCASPAAFERANYMKALTQYQ